VVIDDLQQLPAVAHVDLVRLYQLLGDAYMHEDRLDEALNMYRLARQACRTRSENRQEKAWSAHWSFSSPMPCSEG